MSSVEMAIRGGRTRPILLDVAGHPGRAPSERGLRPAYNHALRRLAADMAAHHDAVSKRYRLLYELADERGARTTVNVLRPGLEVRLFGDRRLDP